MSDDRMPALTAAVTETLEGQGWTLINGGTAIARKSYRTAVGPKEAHVYLELWPTCRHAVLQGDYTSEGRNALGGCGVLLLKTSSRPEIVSETLRFAGLCEIAIADTYAVRLLRD